MIISLTVDIVFVCGLVVAPAIRKSIRRRPRHEEEQHFVLILCNTYN